MTMRIRRSTMPFRRLPSESPGRKWNRRSHHESHIKRNWGMTKEDYMHKLHAQNGRCAICKIPQKQVDRAFSVDHDHESGVLRGLLCIRCNTGIGHLKDDPEIVMNAYKYLMSWLPHVSK